MMLPLTIYLSAKMDRMKVQNPSVSCPCKFSPFVMLFGTTEAYEQHLVEHLGGWTSQLYFSSTEPDAS